MNESLKKTDRIFVAGHRGLVGSALVRVLREEGFDNLILKSRDECDLEDRSAVENLMRTEKPDVVLLAAAKVGGIWANQNLPYDFIEKNLRLELNVIDEAHRAGVGRLIFLGSSCIYPKFAPQPIREESLLTGELEPTNRPYALAKIAGIELCWSLNRQLGRHYFCAMPTNLYGPEDNFDLKSSHVLPALIRKFHEAREQGLPEVEIWGTGTPRREFLYSDDLARGVVFLLRQPREKLEFLFREDRPPLINIGCGEDLTIGELADLVKDVTGYKGGIRLDRTKPDGTPRKLMDSSRLFDLGWKPKVGLREGIETVYRTARDRFAKPSAN